MNNKERFGNFKEDFRARFWFYHDNYFIFVLIIFVIVCLAIFSSVFFTVESILLKTLSVIFGGVTFAGILISFINKILSIAHQKKNANNVSNQIKEEGYIIPIDFNKEYPSGENDNRIYLRYDIVQKIISELKDKDIFILYGKSGMGKSHVLWNFLSHTKDPMIKPNSPFYAVQSILRDIKIKHNSFRYKCVSVEDDGTEPYNCLVIDQIEELSTEELKDIISNVRQPGKETKIIIGINSMFLSELYDFLYSDDNNIIVDKNRIGSHQLTITENMVSGLVPNKDDQRAEKNMGRIRKRLLDGCCSLIEFQFIDRLLNNDPPKQEDSFFSGFPTDYNYDDDSVFQIASNYFKYMLKGVKSSSYVAFLSFMRILSDNKIHKVETQISQITMSYKGELEEFAQILIKERLIQKVSTSSGVYKTTHEWVGTLFTKVTQLLLSNENIEQLDNANDGYDSFSESLKECKKNYDSKTNKGWIKTVIFISVFISLIANGIWCYLGIQQPTAYFLWYQVILRILINMAVFSGILYVGNFLRYCANILSIKRTIYLYIFGLFASAIPVLLFLFSENPKWNYLGLFVLGTINILIGVFYRVNRKNRPLNATIWLMKKGNIFIWIGIAIMAVSAFALFVVNYFLSIEVNDISILLVSKCDVFISMFCYLVYVIIVLLAMKNYIHFQSLPWQRLIIGIMNKK